MAARTVTHAYQDPVDLIWLRAALDLGLEVRRSQEVFAAYDGRGTLTLSEAVDFDADDSLAQMIFHEICHWLIAGTRGKDLPDWGLRNTDESDLVFEHACHRLQAALATPYGLRELLAVTTEWRPYWDSLPADPLRDAEDPAVAIAQNGFHRAQLAPFGSVLSQALAKTAAVADVVRELSPPASLWGRTQARHRLGSLLNSSGEHRCGTCAWAYQSGKLLRCRQHKGDRQNGPAVQLEEAACERWEPSFSGDACASCGACCRRGFDLVPLSARDPFRQLHPELVRERNGEYFVPRPAGSCVALTGNGSAEQPYRCRHYADRPKNCANFAVASDACLVARRRVGLSR